MMYVIELDHLHNNRHYSPPSSVVTAPNKANPSTLKLDYTPEKVASVPRKRMRGFNRQTVDMVRKEMDEFSIWVQQAVDTMAGDDEDKRQRILAILKTKWPECLEQNLTSLECKELIDYEIKNTTLFTGAQDKAISTVILRTRNMEDENFNWIVIRTNSNSGRTIGVWGDGWVYYDFPWNSTGIEADRATLINDIPPWNGNPVVNGSTIDEFRGVINNHETITAGGRRRLSVSIDRTKIIAGGTYTLNYTDTSGPPDSPTAAAQLDAFLSSSKVIGAAGVRNLGPWNCKGLSGVSCCAKIKHSVRDKDVHGKAVQCWIEPFTATLLTKKLCEEDLTKVCIYERHDGKVVRCDDIDIMVYFLLLSCLFCLPLKKNSQLCTP